MKDQVAIVTGGGAGIGAETCRMLADEGVHVAVADLNLETAEQIAEEVRSRGVNAIAIDTDVSDIEQTDAMVEKTISDLGRVDILNNVAGLALPNLFANTRPDTWEKEINVCLYGVMNTCRSVMVPMMEQNSGRIVNVASDAGKTGEKFMVSYSAAKAGILGFSKSLAKELGRNWVGVNCVCPGTTMGTGMTAMINDELAQTMVKKYALRRLGQPEDAAHMITYLSSTKAAGWITGQAMSVNGGYFMG